MADLTPIQFQDPSARADREDTRALSAVIGDTADLAAQLYQEDILMDFKEEADNIAAQSRAAMEAELATPADPAFNFDISDDSADAGALRVLKDDLNRLSNVGRNGTSAQRTLAQLKIKQRLEEFTTQFPTMRSQLAREMGLVLSTNPDMEAMGLAEMAGRGGGGSNADLEKLKDYAYGDLGISRRHAYGSPEFLKQFKERDGVVSKGRWAAIELKAQQESASPDIMVAASSYKTTVASALTQFYDEGVNATFAELVQARESGSDADIQRAKENAMLLYNKTRMGLVTGFEKTFDTPRMQQGPYYESALASHNRALAGLDSMLALITSDNIVGAQQWMAMLRADTLHGMIKDDNQLQAVLAMAENEGLLEVWKNGYFGSSIMARNTDSGLRLLNKIDNLKAGEFLMGSLASRTADDQSEAGYIGRAQGRLPEYPVGGTPEDYEDYATEVLGAIVTPLDPIKEYSPSEMDSAAPTAALDLSSIMIAGYQKMGGTTNPALANDIQNRIESGEFQRLVNHIAGTELAAPKQALQSALHAHRVGWQGDRKLEAAGKDLLRAPVLNTPMYSLITFNSGNVENGGRLTAKINEDEWKKAWAAHNPETRMSATGVGGLGNMEHNQKRALQNKIDAWLKDVNGLMTIQAMEDILINGEANYLESMGQVLVDILPEPGELEQALAALRGE